MQIIQFNVITEIPFDFSQKYQTVPRPNRSATVYFGMQLIYVGCILLKNLNVGPANRPAFCRQVPLFYAKCPSNNILQVGRSACLSRFVISSHLRIYVYASGSISWKSVYEPNKLEMNSNLDIFGCLYFFTHFLINSKLCHISFFPHSLKHILTILPRFTVGAPRN